MSIIRHGVALAGRPRAAAPGFRAAAAIARRFSRPVSASWSRQVLRRSRTRRSATSSATSMICSTQPDDQRAKEPTLRRCAVSTSTRRVPGRSGASPARSRNSAPTTPSAAAPACRSAPNSATSAARDLALPLAASVQPQRRQEVTTMARGQHAGAGGQRRRPGQRPSAPPRPGARGRSAPGDRRPDAAAQRHEGEHRDVLARASDARPRPARASG